MAEKTLFVRVLPKSGAESFFRCGIKFTREWQLVYVDEATAARLHEEQMLEVSETLPDAGDGAPADADALGALMKEISEKADAAPAPAASAEPVAPAEPAEPVAPAAPKKAGK